MNCPTCDSKVDGRKKAPQFPQHKPLMPTKYAVKNLIENFLYTGSSAHSKNTGMLQYIIDYCEQKKIPYVLQAVPGKGYYIQKVPGKAYASHGDPETTKAVKFALEKSLKEAHWGGPNKWNSRLLRYVGRLMRDYAIKYYQDHADEHQFNFSEQNATEEAYFDYLDKSLP